MAVSQETFLTAFVESTQTIVERCISISQFDKTILATIKGKDKNNSKLYYVSSYGCPNLAVYALLDDNTIYLVNDEVYVNLPNGDFRSENKYIIGKVAKVSPQVVIKTIDDMLVDPRVVFDFRDIENNFGYQTLILYFNAWVSPFNENPIVTNNYVPIGIQEEKIFPIKITGTSRSTGATVERTMMWTTNNLYGNIFRVNDEVDEDSKRLYIIIDNLLDLTNITIDFGNLNSNIFTTVDLIYLNQSENDDTVYQGALRFSEINGYIGHDIDILNQDNINNIYVLLTYYGPVYFYKEEDVWHSCLNIDELNNHSEYRWQLQWYTYNPLQTDYLSYNNPIPQYWDPISGVSDGNYRNKMIFLSTEDLATYTSSSKYIYSILE